MEEQQQAPEAAMEAMPESIKITRQYSDACHAIGDLVFKTEMNKKAQDEIDAKLLELKQKQKVLNARYMEAVDKEKKESEKKAKSVIVAP